MDTTQSIQLSQYRLDTLIGQNEWFTFYKGQRKTDGTTVRVKVLAPHLSRNEFVVRRLQHVTRQIAQLEHPHILPTYEAEQEEDWFYVVQDYVETQTLDKILETDGPFTLKRTTFIAAQIASALDSAHQKSVMHGGLSAKNIYLDQNDQVYLAEFGETQAIFGINLSKHPLDIVAPETIAPERVYGQGPSRPADLYSLGILCYQMLVGRPPFTGPASTILHGQAYIQPRPLHEVNPGIPIAVSEIVERMLAKGIELRYNTGTEFVRAFDAACRTQKSLRSYDRIIPLMERDRPQPNIFKIVFYWTSAIIAMLLVALLSAWTGYEWALRRPLETALPATLEVQTTLPLTLTSGTIDLPSTLTMTSTTTGHQAPAQPVLRSLTTLSDSFPEAENDETGLLPAVTPTLPPTVTPTPTVAIVTPLSPTATPEPPQPANKTLFVFFNPTGYDLIVDLTGPTSGSALIPPGQQHEFTLDPGPYLYMVHTPGGKGLDSIAANFELAQGQVIEKDYYSDYSWARQ